MAAEDLFIDNSREREAVEAVCKRFPELKLVKIYWGCSKSYLDVIPTFAFVIETVDSVDRGALVITSEKEEVLGVSWESLNHFRKEDYGLLNFVREEEANCF